MLPRRAVRVVVVVRPSQSQLLLPAKLHPCGMIPAHPMLALGREEQVASPVAPDIHDRGVHDAIGLAEPVGIVVKVAFTPAQILAMLHRLDCDARIEDRRQISEIAVSLHHEQLAVLPRPPQRHACNPQLPERLPVDPRLGDLVRREKIRDKLHFQRHPRRLPLHQQHARKHAQLVHQTLGPLRRGKRFRRVSHVQQPIADRLVACARRNLDVVDPIAEPRPRLRQHPIRQLFRIRAAVQKIIDNARHQRGRLRLRLPLELPQQSAAPASARFALLRHDQLPMLKSIPHPVAHATENAGPNRIHDNPKSSPTRHSAGRAPVHFITLSLLSSA